MATDGGGVVARLGTTARRAFFRCAELVAPGPAGRLAQRIWFVAYPRMPELPVPDGGEPFCVRSQGVAVRGRVWGEGPVVYLVHGWGGRGAQLAALVVPLVTSGHRVVMFDVPSHGESDPGPAYPRTHGVEFARALDDVFARFGPAEAVVAHSIGAIATYLAMRFGWLGARRLVFVAPMVQIRSMYDDHQAALGFGPRTRRSFDRAVADFVGITVADFDARVQARHVEALPTLVVADRDDRQTPYADAVDLALAVDAELMTTERLGHRKVLRDPAVVQRVVAFVRGEGRLEEAG